MELDPKTGTSATRAFRRLLGNEFEQTRLDFIDIYRLHLPDTRCLQTNVCPVDAANVKSDLHAASECRNCAQRHGDAPFRIE